MAYHGSPLRNSIGRGNTNATTDDAMSKRITRKHSEKVHSAETFVHNRMLDDAHQRKCDRVVLVSGDSDLVPALNMVKMLFPSIELIVYVPSRNAIRGAATEIRTAADKDRTLPLSALKHAQFPPTLSDGGGGILTKPSDW